MHEACNSGKVSTGNMNDITGVSWVFREGSLQRIGFALTYVFDKCTPLSLCSDALAVTLPGFAGEECLPLPRSKGGAFPFLLTLGGAPPLPRISLRDNGVDYKLRKLELHYD